MSTILVIYMTARPVNDVTITVKPIYLRSRWFRQPLGCYKGHSVIRILVFFLTPLFGETHDMPLLISVQVHDIEDGDTCSLAENK